MMTLRLLFSVFVFLFSTGLLIAQKPCFSLYPNKSGAVLVKTAYDANKKAQAKMTIKVSDSSQGLLQYELADAKGNTTHRGEIALKCKDGMVETEMLSRLFLPEVIKVQKGNVEVESCVLNYPDAFSYKTDIKPNSLLTDGDVVFSADEGKKQLLKLTIRNRQYLGREDLEINLGTFKTVKTSYYCDVLRDGKTTKGYRVVEWYAVGLGIVRSETYDANKQLIGYSELTEKRGI